MNRSVPLPIVHPCQARAVLRVRSGRGAPPAMWRRAFIVFQAWLARRRSRDELAHLDDRMLRDIGLTRDWVGEQRSKAFWRA